MGIKNLKLALKRFMNNSNNGVSLVLRSEALDKKTVAIDASFLLYTYYTAEKEREKFINSDGKNIIHIRKILDIALFFISKYCKPVFVFDGKAPEEKIKTLSKRNSAKDKIIDEIDILKKKNTKIFKRLKNVDNFQTYEECLECYIEFETICKEIDKQRSKQVFINNEQWNEIFEILDILGIPYIKAPSEADFQCVHMLKTKKVNNIVTGDMDFLTLGAKKILIPEKNGYYQMFELGKILKELDMTHDQFIDFSILLGCDYTGTLHRVGYVGAYNIIKNYGSIDKYFQKEDIEIPEDFNYIRTRQIFKNIHADKEFTPQWMPIDYEALKNKLTENKIKESTVKYYYNNFYYSQYNVLIGTRTEKEDLEINDGDKDENDREKNEHETHFKLMVFSRSDNCADFEYL